MNGYYTNGNGSHSNDPNPYANSGDDGYNSYNRYDYSDRGDSRSRDRKPGGYGGLLDTETTSVNPQSTLRGELDRRKANRMSGENRWRSRSRGGDSRGGPRRIEDVLQYIQQDWSFMTADKCVPAQIALQLLDDSSLGLARRHREFQDTQHQLQSSLKSIVNEHHQGFNSSIGTFHQIQASIQASQQKVRGLKDSLIKAKGDLVTPKAEFTSLIAASQDYEGMLSTIASIEAIQRLPDQFEAKIAEKHFLSAVEDLQEAQRLIRSPDIDSLGAVADMKVYLSNQEHSLSDILTEELHNHLYLKSPYCEDRWLQYVRYHGKDAHSTSLDSSQRKLFEFLNHLTQSEPLSEDSSRNPEADSFRYILLIAEALNKLGTLEEAVDTIEQRMPVELFQVIERSNTEVQQRYPSSTRLDIAKGKDVFDLKGSEIGQRVLDDLLKTVYARFEAIAEAHCAFHESMNYILRRDGSWSNARSTRGFKELWKFYQSEIRSILHDYLSTSERALSSQGPGDGNIFRQQRDRARRCHFKIDNVDSKAAEMQYEQDEIIAMWHKFVPGMASLPSTSPSTGTSSDARQADNSATGHKLLVRPSVANVTSVLPPSVLFLNRFKSIIPPTSDIAASSLSAFLNDFLVNVFHPQLEETLTEVCAQSFAQLDAFQEDPHWAHYSRKPIFKGTVKFLDTVRTVSTLLDELTHDQMFTHLVLSHMNSYYDKSCAWYKALIARSQPKPDGRTLKAAASLADDSDISQVARKLWEDEVPNRQELIEQETKLLIVANKDMAVDASDLIFDQKTQRALCLLFNSMRWLAKRLVKLRRISEHATDSTGMDDSDHKPHLKRSLTATMAAEQRPEVDGEPYLPLSNTTGSLFDGIVEGFEDLADVVLRTLHLDLRCQIIQKFGESFKRSLLLSDSGDAPDEDVMQLISGLLEFNQEATASLFLREAQYADLRSPRTSANYT